MRIAYRPRKIREMDLNGKESTLLIFNLRHQPQRRESEEGGPDPRENEFVRSDGIGLIIIGD